METNRESHCWWFNSYNSPRFSPWLESTLAELNDKTKTMLNLIEEDADSFAQRAEMYYKKRPELISMVEDFYRAHRSLAERHDQLKSDRVVRVKSPLRHSLSLPKEECTYVFDSPVKTFDTCTEAAYNYEEAAESEVDDPEQDDDVAPIDKPFAGEASYGELMKLRDELDRLREENEIQRNIIKQKDEEKDEIVKQLSDNIRELKEEMAVVRNENLGVVMKQSGETILPFDEVTNLNDENKFERKQVKKKAGGEVNEVMRKIEAEKGKNLYLEDGLARKEEENVEIKRKLEEANRQLKEVVTEKDEEKTEAIRQMKKALVLKDEEKREVIRQLSVAMEMIREESKHLKKSIRNTSPRKRNGN